MKIAIFSEYYLPQINGIAYRVYNNKKCWEILGHKVDIFSINEYNDVIKVPFINC